MIDRRTFSTALLAGAAASMISTRGIGRKRNSAEDPQRRARCTDCSPTAPLGPK